MTQFSIGPYRVIEPIGRGGMGEVYLAEDSRLGRKVALKTLTADIATAEHARRLLHEARAAATLNHPAIASVFDVVEESGRAWLVMEYVEGETLAQRLTRGALPVADALALTAQLLDALAEAHRRGILHRDLKPSNLIITPTGALKILDFGIARIRPQEDAGTRTAGPYTAAQQVVGSPGYSAPEQLLGRPLDQRADVYGAGVLLFEMLAGQRPFKAPDLMSAALTALTERPPDLHALNAAVSPALNAIVARAMERDPEKRFASAQDMRAALARVGEGSATTTQQVVPHVASAGWRRRIVAAATMLILLGAGVPLYRYWRSAAAGDRTGRRVVAVLPFDNLSGDPAKDYLGAGMAETISTTLARQPALVVIPRSEIVKAAGTSRTPSVVAKELGAGFVVKGGIQQAQDELQVTLQVLRADGSTAWADTDRDVTAHVFALQERVATRIAEALQVRAQAARPQPHVVNPDALADYWQGRALLERRNVEGNIERAIALFDHAVAGDPAFALAHAALGEAYWAKYTATKDASWTKRATEEGTSAVTLEPDDPDVRVSLATLYRGTGRRDDAIRELRRALELQPQHAQAHSLLAGVLADRGDIAGAVEEMQHAIALRPAYWGHYDALGTILSDASRYRDAADAYRKVVELQPDSGWGFGQLGFVYQMLGDTKQAMTNYERAVALGPTVSAVSNLGSLYYHEKRYADAAQAFERAVVMRPNLAMNQRNLGDAYQKLGRSEAARAAYLRAVDLAEAELRVNPNDALNLARLAVYEAKVGRAREAERHIREAEQARPELATVQFRKAVVYALINRPDVAVAAAQKAVAQGYPITQLRDEEDLMALRNQPGFTALIHGADTK
jgi:serine/threonine-protein kinase